MARHNSSTPIAAGISSSHNIVSGAPLPAQNNFAKPSVSPAALTDEQKRLVKASVPVLQEHGKRIATHFYKRMLANHPELKNVFNLAHQETGAQPLALATSVFTYAANIDNLGKV